MTACSTFRASFVIRHLCFVIFPAIFPVLSCVHHSTLFLGHGSHAPRRRATLPSGSCCGSTPSADIGFAWATRSRWASRTRQGTADVPILGDLSSRHACIRRDGEGYLVEACARGARQRPPGARRRLAAATARGMQLGGAVRLLFRRPHPLSATARLDFVSRHRTQPSADSVLLMADACVLGPKPHSHVVCRDWTREVILYRRGQELYCRTDGPFEIDGVACSGRRPNHQEFPHRGRRVFVQFGGDTIESLSAVVAR